MERVSGTPVEEVVSAGLSLAIPIMEANNILQKAGSKLALPQRWDLLQGLCYAHASF